MTTRSASRRSRRAAVAALLGAVGALAAGPASAGEPVSITLEAPAAVWGLRLADGVDGTRDLWIASGRDVHLWRGTKGSATSPAASAVFHVPEDATFVGPGRFVGEGAGRTRTLLALARTQALRVVAGRGAAVEEGLELEMPFRDPARAVLADLGEGRSLFLPTKEGIRFVPDWLGAPAASVVLPLRPTKTVTAAGAFVEDGATVKVSWPRPTLVPAWPPAAGSSAVFWFGDDGIHAFAKGADGAYADRVWPTSFLAKDGDRRDVLVDFDADGTPDWAHAVTTNDSGAYSFFRTPGEVAKPGAPPADLRPARGTIHLKGFQLPAEYPDLDGDGRPDLVVTTIGIDGSNVMRAVMQHRVKAQTHAFLNRSAKGAEFFTPRPDATIESDIGVQILFTFSGSIEVKRSFTILPGADLDGDRRKDLVIRTGPETLSVYRGTADGVWSPSPTTLPIPAVGKSPDVEGYAGDLDGDGRDDLVLLYRAPPAGTDRTIVVFAGGT